MNRKWGYALFCMLMLVVLSVQPAAAAAAKTQKVKVTLVSAELVENNHVGNEWWRGGFANGKKVAEGASVVLSVKSTDTIRLLAQAQEQDKYPDDGEASASVKVSALAKPVTKALNVTIVENRGRYSGETAKWKFVFRVEKVKA